MSRKNKRSSKFSFRKSKRKISRAKKSRESIREVGKELAVSTSIKIEDLKRKLKNPDN